MEGNSQLIMFQELTINDRSCLFNETSNSQHNCSDAQSESKSTNILFQSMGEI